MATLYQNIRAGLQKRAATASGFPPYAQRAYEGKDFTPTTGTPWARFTLLPSYGRAYSVDAETKEHRGLLQIDLFYPPKRGTATIEAMADTLKAVFNPGLRLPVDDDLIIVMYAERNQTITDPDWIHVPVTVGWRCYSGSN